MRIPTIIFSVVLFSRVAEASQELPCAKRMESVAKFMARNHPGCFSPLFLTCDIRSEIPNSDGIKMSYRRFVWEPYEGQKIEMEMQLIFAIDRSTLRAIPEPRYGKVDCVYKPPY